MFVTCYYLFFLLKFLIVKHVHVYHVILNTCTCKLFHNADTYMYFEGGALAYWLERRTPDRETRVRSSAGSVCCFLEQETFTPQKYWKYPGISGSVFT